MYTQETLISMGTHTLCILPNIHRVVIPLCGGNIDTTILGRCLDRGLAADGRLVKFTVTVSDRPGGIAELASTLSKMGVSIKDMMHERAWIKNDIFSVEVGHKKGLLLDTSLALWLSLIEYNTTKSTDYQDLL